MPIYEIVCRACGRQAEVLVSTADQALVCPSCGSQKTNKLMSATSTLTGRGATTMPGPKDTACCGASPGQAAGCAGPGSCCGKTF
jgi:putative FmdB family regulatory protein